MRTNAELDGDALRECMAPPMSRVPEVAGAGRRSDEIVGARIHADIAGCANHCRFGGKRQDVGRIHIAEALSYQAAGAAELACDADRCYPPFVAWEFFAENVRRTVCYVRVNWCGWRDSNPHALTDNRF